MDRRTGIPGTEAQRVFQPAYSVQDSAVSAASWLYRPAKLLSVLRNSWHVVSRTTGERMPLWKTSRTEVERGRNNQWMGKKKRYEKLDDDRTSVWFSRDSDNLVFIFSDRFIDVPSIRLILQFFVTEIRKNIWWYHPLVNISRKERKGKNRVLTAGVSSNRWWLISQQSTNHSRASRLMYVNLG